MVNHQLQKKAVKTTVVALLLFFLLPTSQGALIDPDKVIDDTVRQRLNNLEATSRMVIVLAAVSETSRPFEDSEALLRSKDADLVILYQYKQNKLSLTRPTIQAKAMATVTKGLAQVLGSRDQEKIAAVTREQKNKYLTGLLDGLHEVLLPQRDTRQYCATVKDGYCEQECPGIDLDCLCGDATCQYHEAAAACPADCEGAREQLCTILRDGICDEKCRGDIDCRLAALVSSVKDVHEERNISYAAMMAAILAVVLAIAAVTGYLLHRRLQWKQQKGMR